MKLTNKVIVISGAGRGVGRSIALALASEKTRLVLIARTVSELEDLASSASLAPCKVAGVDAVL